MSSNWREEETEIELIMLIILVSDFPYVERDDGHHCRFVAKLVIISGLRFTFQQNTK